MSLSFWQLFYVDWREHGRSDCVDWECRERRVLERDCGGWQWVDTVPALLLSIKFGVVKPLLMRFAAIFAPKLRITSDIGGRLTRSAAFGARQTEGVGNRRGQAET